jgi:hypothetical protein
MSDHYAELRLDGAAWAEYVAEGELWEATPADGLASVRAARDISARTR